MLPQRASSTGFWLASLLLRLFLTSPRQGFFGQGLTLALVLFPLASSDCYIYDSATGYYYDPLAGTYYDPNTQVSLGLCYFINDSFLSIYFLNIYLFIFGCAGSLLLHGLFSSCGGWGLHFIAASGLLSLQWLLLLPSIGSRHGASAAAAHRL